MRDIRDDLQERADSCHDQIRAICNRFEDMVQQLQCERDTKIADLKSALTMIEKVMQFESWSHGSAHLADQQSNKARDRHRAPRIFLDSRFDVALKRRKLVLRI